MAAVTGKMVEVFDELVKFEFDEIISVKAEGAHMVYIYGPLYMDDDTISVAVPMGRKCPKPVRKGFRAKKGEHTENVDIRIPKYLRYG